MRLRAVSMAILGVGAIVAVLNMAFHPLARMSVLSHDNSDLRAHTLRNRTRGVEKHAARVTQRDWTARKIAKTERAWTTSGCEGQGVSA